MPSLARSCLILVLVLCLQIVAIAEKQLIVVSLPDNDYYKNNRDDIAYFVKDLAAKAADKDNVLVLFPKKFLFSSTGEKYGGFDFGDAYVLPVTEPIDLWMRDFGLVLPNDPVKFRYVPDYLKKVDSIWVDNSFRKLISKYGAWDRESTLKVDGGNVVDNGVDKAIVTHRFIKKNAGGSSSTRVQESLKRELEKQLGMKVAIIPDPRDTTGHADGVVSFIDTDVLVIADYCDAAYYKLVKDAVEEVFPYLTIIKMPCMSAKKDTSKKKKPHWRGFSSAVGAYVNILLTDSSVYVPQFGKANLDSKALEIVRKNTYRRVVSVHTERLSHMGGSIRCMSWQISMSNPLATEMLAAAEGFMQIY